MVDDISQCNRKSPVFARRIFTGIARCSTRGNFACNIPFRSPNDRRFAGLYESISLSLASVPSAVRSSENCSFGILDRVALHHAVGREQFLPDRGLGGINLVETSAPQGRRLRQRKRRRRLWSSLCLDARTSTRPHLPVQKLRSNRGQPHEPFGNINALTGNRSFGQIAGVGSTRYFQCSIKQCSIKSIW